MRVMARGARVSVLVLLLILPASAGAQSAGYDFSVSPNPPNEGQEATFTLTPTSADVEQVRWDLDGDEDFDDGSTREVRHTYANRGPVTVQMRAREENGEPFQVVTKTIVVNGPPTAEFDFAPAAPLAGQVVSFTSSVSDAESDAVTLGWRFGDGATATGPSPRHTYATRGTYSVVLTATDEHGLVATRNHTVTVAANPGPAPPPPPAGPAPTGSGQPVAPILLRSPARRPVLMRPFPIVRIAGVVLRDGALIRILSVRAPRRARVRLRCLGQGCPVKAVARTSARRLMRFRRFERRLAAGVRLELFVRQPGRIGKYTRFLIRGGKPPARVDRCLVPGKRRPVRCP